MEMFLDILGVLAWQEWFVIICAAILVFGIAQLEKLADAIGDGVDSVTRVITGNGETDNNQKDKQ